LRDCGNIGISLEQNACHAAFGKEKWEREEMWELFFTAYHWSALFGLNS
jgi:hypothetical protein